MSPISKIFLVITTVTTLYIFIRWLERVAEKKLEGKTLPEDTGLNLQNPDGAVFYFYHPRCGPCKSMSPIIDELKQQYPDRVEKINIADRSNLAMIFGIRATPTIVMVKNYRIICANIGYSSEKKLATLLETCKSEVQSP
jgi:thioredoxin 1